MVGEIFQLADEMLALGYVVHLHHQGPLAAAISVVALGHRYQSPGAMAIGVLKAFLKAAALYLATAQSGELVFPDGDIVAVHKICKRQPRQVLHRAAGKKGHGPIG